jgi:tetratricopeptide (TPR) repeat protein
VVGFHFLERASAALGRNDLEGTAGNLLRATYFGYAVSNTHEHLASFLGSVYLSSEQKDPRLLSLVEGNYRKAIALNTVDGDLYARVAEFYRRLGRRQEAMDYLGRAMERYPHFQKYRVAYAEVLAEDGQQEKALRLLEEINDFLRRTAPLEPVRVRTLLAMAHLHKMKGDEERFREYTGQATRLREMLPKQSRPLR